MSIGITIFTPTYNRSYCLKTLYDSLTLQSCFDFEWLIVDDGSSDDTQKLVQSWIEGENRFTIRYKKVTNGGKHRAINIGVKMSCAPYFFIVDSDDQLRSDAVSQILDWFSHINQIEYAGVSGNRVYKDGSLIGRTFKEPFIDSTYLERSKYRIFGDKAEVFYTNILKEYPFPEIPNEKFCTEALIWNRIASDGYKMRWYNEGIYVCEYLEDGLSHKTDSLLKDNIGGYKLYCSELLKYKIPLYKKVACIGNYARRARACGMKFDLISKDIKTPLAIVCALYVCSRIFYAFRRYIGDKRS